ncbi:NAD(+)--rifampin ADP-ribosyltransferase [Streptomyces mutabilis]|uniref:NAD(+)--rifampin ADP-ribosyltransferase n=1 Tax=Streptomyces mutabilis TaxID=67332 RepID=UPI0022BA6A8E|nr:NAD(+)--rifampin ADP-ribosyltransferase [Streptomyces mutabilis]MCZ9351671.1 NAD(+)--rifampin ADP-ribosyltransferase [Streptomyces mutabilis]
MLRRRTGGSDDSRHPHSVSGVRGRNVPARHEGGPRLGRPADPRPRVQLEDGRTSRHVCVSETLERRHLGRRTGHGDRPGRIHVVEPTGDLEDVPDITGKRFPGNSMRSYRTCEPVHVVSELVGWD